MRIAIALTVLLAAHTAAAVTVDDLSVYYGTERATLGSWFGKLAFGGVDAPQLRRPLQGVKVELVRIGQRIDGVDLEIPATACDGLEAALTSRWGPPNDDGHNYGIGWYAKSGTQAAVYETNSGFDLPCRLRFFRRVSAQQWLNRSRQSVVPLWAIGKPVAELETSITVLAPTLEDHELRWEDTAIDGTHVKLSAEVRGKRVIRISVSVDTNVLQAWHRLLALFGKPGPSHMLDDTLSWRWHHAPTIEVDTFVGDLPPPRLPTEPSGFPLTITFGG